MSEREKVEQHISPGMDAGKVVAELEERYPGKTIISLPSEDPTEIICEVDPTSEHPEWSEAVAVIKRSDPHVHLESTEDYSVTRGVVNLHLGDKHRVMEEGESYRIEPGIVHWAEVVDAPQGNGAWVRVKSVPGWRPQDHIITDTGKNNN